MSLVNLDRLDLVNQVNLDLKTFPGNILSSGAVWSY